jgi:putative transposase
LAAVAVEWVPGVDHREPPAAASAECLRVMGVSGVGAKRSPRLPNEFLELVVVNRRRHQHRRNCNYLGHSHELTFSCYQRYPFLKAERTCRWLADAIEDARQHWSFDLWAYVFMPEHVHLIVHPRESKYDIAQIRKAIKAPVGSKAVKYIKECSPDWLPRITRRRGDKTERLFWQSGGGYDRNVIEPRTLLSAIDYIHMNPVRRELVERPVDWVWSSAAWYLGAGMPSIIPDPIPAEWMDTATS